jgi:hypothetical protein
MINFLSERLPFSGETMVCLLCGSVQKSDPKVASDWRAIHTEGATFYACPEHFPPDGASAKAFEKAYSKFIRRAIRILRGET